VNTEKFIVLEGIDGSGTTTQSSLLSERLSKLGHHSHLTFEPTKSPIGDIIRSVLHHNLNIHPGTLAYLFAADRHEHLYNQDHGILKFLASGSWVIQDRYVFSSLAYQSIDCGFSLVSTLNNKFPMPGITFFLDLPAESAISRLKLRSSERDLFEKIEFQEKAREMYQNIFSQYAEHTKVITIDASLPQKEVHELIWKHIAQMISIASP